MESEQHPLLNLPGWTRLVEDNLHMNPADAVLEWRKQAAKNGRDIDFSPEVIHALGEQLDCYKRVRSKFPNWHTPGMIYSRKALEQSTGEAAARYRSSLYNGKLAVDLTTGLGMDAFALSFGFEKVFTLEKHFPTHQIARHNYRFLKESGDHKPSGEVEHLHEDSGEWIRENKTLTAIDLIYADPSRRDDQQRVFLLEDCEPNIPGMISELRRMAPKIVLKLSPLFDITALKKSLPGVELIRVVSVNGEVKEVIAEIGRDDAPETETLAVLLDKPGNVISELRGSGAESGFISGWNSEPLIIPAEAPLSGWICEPDAAIIKAGLTHRLADGNNVFLMHERTGYLISRNEPPEVINKTCRCHKIGAVLSWQQKSVKKFLKQNGISRAHIHRRDFPESTDTLFKKLGLKMGDQAHLHFTRDRSGGPVVVVGDM